MTEDAGFAVFDTAVGPCGIAWTGAGIVGVQLPEGTAAATRARMQKRFPGLGERAPTPGAGRAMGAISDLLSGKRVDLDTVPLDLSGVSPFYRRVYEAARAIPPGETLTYGDVAARIGSPGSARAVGQALGRNPFAIVVPCHRVLAAGGKVGGFSANGGTDTKRRLLAIEGAAVPPDGRRDGTAPGVAGASGFRFSPDVAVAHLRASDPKLARLIDDVGPFAMKVDETRSLFLALAEAIVHQQLTGKAAATIFGRVRALFPAAPDAAEGLSPRAILGAPDEVLRGAGLSRAKLLALRDLSRHMEEGTLPSLREAHAMDDHALVERLVAVRGVGRWTVEMLLMFRLGRPDVFPLDDLGIKKGFLATFGPTRGQAAGALPDRATMIARGERWAPYRSVASWYLWRAAERAPRG